MTTYWQDGDIASQIDGLGGVTVTVGAVTAKGLLDIEDVSQDADTGVAVLHGKQISVIVRTATFSAVLTQGASIIADGTTYKIVMAEQIGDGALTRVYCARI